MRKSIVRCRDTGGTDQCRLVQIHHHYSLSSSLTKVLLFITLVSSVFTLRGAKAQLPADMCNTPPCRACANKCPSFNKQEIELNDCSKKLALAKSYLLPAAKQECKATPCLPILLKNVCGLLRGAPIPPKRWHLLAALDDAIVQAKKDVIQYEGKTKKLIESQDAKRQAYFQELIRELNKIQLSFKSALKTRSTYFKLKHYMGTVKYRRVLQQVDKLRRENDQLQAQLRFWYIKNKALKAAVNTSTLGLKAARDAMKAEYIAYANDAALVDVLVKTSLNKEQRAAMLVQLTERTRSQLEDVQTLIAKVRAGRRFIRKAKTEIFNMLIDILKRIELKRVQVPCGALALSDMVTENIMETTPINIDDD